MIRGVNPLAFFLIPMLGDRHPNSYPRFRDVFISDEENPEYDDHIHVYTRVGGGNRGEGYGEEELYNHPNFVTTFDDSFDTTYGTYVFSVPDDFKNDFELIKSGKANEVSEMLRGRIYTMFPKLTEQLDSLFGKEATHE